MKRGLSTLLVIGVAAAAGGAMGAAGPGAAAGHGPSPLIYPAETIPIRFDHAQHAKTGATCESCHVAAPTSLSANDNLIPREASCLPCHKIDRAQPTKAVGAGQPDARCDSCHADGQGNAWMPTSTRDQPPRVVLARPNLKFNHRLHASRSITCTQCHTNAATQGMVTRSDLPMMASCLTCHDSKQATNRCGACHPTEADGRIKTKLLTMATAAAGATRPLVPSGSLKGLDAHGPDFKRNHAQVGRDESYCLTCHRRNECIECHGGVVRPPDIHPADYVSLHVGDARRNTPDCSSCHRATSFCVGCHQRTGVSPDHEGGLRGRRPSNPFGTGTQLKRFHPPGWARDEAGELLTAPRANSHALQAKRNIRTCVSCHREDSCLACHSTDVTRGPTFSPHGPRFGATAKCRFLSARNQRGCLKCHAPGSPELDCD